MTRKMSTLLFQIVTGLFVVLTLVACTKKTTRNDEFVLGISSAPPTLDPRYATDAEGMRIDQLIFSGLVSIGSDLKVAPDAARTWTFKDKTYTFELAKGLKFHNGRLVDKDDLLFSFEKFHAKSSALSSGLDNVETFEAEQAGDHVRVKLKMKKDIPNWILTELPLFKILPKKEFEDFPQTLLGTGSFKFIESSDAGVDLEAVSDHAYATPKIRYFHLKIIRDDFTRFQKLIKGELDAVIVALAPDKVKVFEKKEKEFNVYHYSGTSMTYLLLNMRDPMIQNREFRRALSEALNRPELIKYKLEGLAHEATSILPPVHPFFNSELQNPSFNLADAKATIEKIGDKGKKLTFKTSNNPYIIDHSKVIAYELSKAGIDVELESFEWGKFYADVKKGNFQMAIMKWLGVIDPDIYRMAFSSKEMPPGRNRGFYVNKKIDELLEKVSQAETEPQRKVLYNQIQREVFDDYAILPLWYEEQVAVFRKNVHGFEPSQAGDYLPLIKVSK
jgi:peptide/nickel transport system substrate-binding protein